MENMNCQTQAYLFSKLLFSFFGIFVSESFLKDQSEHICYMLLLTLAGVFHFYGHAVGMRDLSILTRDQTCAPAEEVRKSPGRLL